MEVRGEAVAEMVEPTLVVVEVGVEKVVVA